MSWSMSAAGRNGRVMQTCMPAAIARMTAWWTAVAINSDLWPADSGEMISLQSFSRLLRAHAAAAGQCCIEKIMTRSVAEGIALVRSLGDA